MLCEGIKTYFWDVLHSAAERRTIFYLNINTYSTHFNLVTNEGIMNVLQEERHKLWKFHSEQRKLG